MTILVTGGAGYIGTHTVVELLNAGSEVIVLDNLSNSSIEALNRVERITGKSVTFYQGDILNKALLQKVFSDHNIDAVIHFAGLKAVGESVAKPLKYYENNVTGTLILCQVMAEFKVKNLVFSSSATVYGDPASLPITEDFPTGATNPYGQSKLMVEHILADLHHSDPSWNIARLRYFNPVGAHASGLIGEDPNDIPNNLMPFIAQVAVGKREALSVFGNDYPTHDGTGVRDYIHVVDLAIGHLKALEKLATKPGLVTYNLGTGQGYSVLDMVKAFEKACGKSIAYQIAPRRPGDIAACYANPEHARTDLGWQATHSIEDMANSSWHWQSTNPNGYKS
ncbi:UDP-glucose 4-epimerase GalE [Shewanella xiamenensis]|jgi:UDP-glucose 4-epimerase|uniref:UDP-glucose 4-epimerase n=1 Tax=Shewanella xiamenensis TaxID=332186 RepID=A0ABT6UA44_9GAMM|nr:MULTISPECIES: UDP-glucose 4-epimerase GalE [Shewanella]ASF14922.1 UDP-glucose 4-epimerase GalE [Shewanella sp. FDAARGOS_354]MCH7424290.1 UDP-glucose 4-epimerase GalE [Shewanella sp. MM_2022_3]MCT8866040.1 UDP-glucose 4-epimerase GalE [Shewanella xiamenensis]MDH1313145.1 UDP-glucose 4-epimerase GalE [Shewanella xiamenensis]MDI5830366.1 UDP-glucose 4-epimerase GalE [Shewanella xiamenensis]